MREVRRDERGAVALVAALLSLVLVMIGALAVDVGVQRVARTDMQSLADVVALDLSRELGDRTVGTLSPLMPELAQASRIRNGSTLGHPPDLRIDLGQILVNGSFQSLSGTAVPTAVRVTASTSVDFAFGIASSGGVTRSAVSAATSLACYKIGSWAAALNSADSVLLNPVFRQMAMQSGKFTNGAAVGALDYRGLAQSTVNLNQLAAQLGIASLNELAGATVSARSFYAALEALATPSNSTVVNALHVLAINANSNATLRLGTLIAADAGSGSLIGATANVLDLVGGSVSVLNGTNVANVYLGATLPSLTSAGLAVKLIQGPHQYCGRPGSPATVGVTSDTEQLNAHLGGTLNPTTVDFVPTPIAGLLSSVTSATITAENYATFDLSVAGTSSRLTSVTCGNPQGVTLDVSNGLATLTFSTPLRAEVRAKLNVLSFLGLPSLVDAVISVNATVKVVATIGNSGVVNLAITVPPQAFDTPYPTSSGGVSIVSSTRTGANVSAHLALLNGALGAGIALSSAQQNQLLDSILGAGLTQLLSPTDPHSLSTTVFDPLLNLIGAAVGGSDVFLDSTPSLTCSQPRLVG